MTAVDVEMARELVTAIDASSAFDNVTVQYAHDPEIKLAEAAGKLLQVDGTLQYQRQDRVNWSRSVTIDVIATAKQEKQGNAGNTEHETEKDDWLTFLDDVLVSHLKTQALKGRNPLTINFVQRMDREKLRTNHMFYSHIQITFPIV